MKLENHCDLYRFKLNPEYTPVTEQRLLDINPWELGIDNFSPNEKMKSYVKKVEDKLQYHAHDVPIYAN